MLDSDDNRELWKLTGNKEGKGEAEDMEDESHEDADPIHQHCDVRQVPFMQVETDSHSPLGPEAMLKDLIGSITKVEDYPVARGGFGEIWKCIHETDLGPVLVAVKSLLTCTSDQVGEAMEKKTKRIRRELKICLRLKHPNILHVHGYTSGFGPFIAIVSSWADNGNLTTYLKREGTSLTIVKRFQILRDVAAGLQYLHSNNIIHGDLTGLNVLIHGDGTACLADFGLSLLYSDIVSISQASWTSGFHGNFRWLAPELLGMSEDNLPVRPRKYSDIYSFGNIMLQVLTSKVPYYYLHEAVVTVHISTGVKPSRSLYPAFSDKYWHFIEECWSAATQERPSTERVVEVISDEFDLLCSSTEY
ncbi:kinase-like protein [Rhizopogon vinicolor AM-OR11-026]|uniref:Kinase-like protein n=1 Tax=Rhizopogon vinicolor AM-OR11-026 TaxID=1314800 RepID=A0A1B7N8Y8_9AGAM|nr:kinase-like protein [Rhizopogon vinicolor AM-OR11-026]